MIVGFAAQLFSTPLRFFALCAGVSSHLLLTVRAAGVAAAGVAVVTSAPRLAVGIGSAAAPEGPGSTADGSMSFAPAITVPSASASAPGSDITPLPTSSLALVPHVNDVQRFIDGLGPEAARHLHYISDNRVRCLACKHDITGGEEFRGSLTSRLQIHIATDAHGSRVKSLAGMSSISSYFSSASVASQSCGDPSDPVYERAVDRFLRQTHVFCVG